MQELDKLEGEFFLFLEDTMSNFFVYVRKECEELSRSGMKELLKSGKISEEDFTKSCLKAFTFFKKEARYVK